MRRFLILLLVSFNIYANQMHDKLRKYMEKTFVKPLISKKSHIKKTNKLKDINEKIKNENEIIKKIVKKLDLFERPLSDTELFTFARRERARERGECLDDC